MFFLCVARSATLLIHRRLGASQFVFDVSLVFRFSEIKFMVTDTACFRLHSTEYL